MLRLIESIKKGLQKQGFSFIEVVTPCPEIFGRRNKMATGKDVMNWYKTASKIRNFYDPAKTEITQESLIVGEFVDIEKPTFDSLLRKKNNQVQKRIGGKNT